jgi:hypothetical protein
VTRPEDALEQARAEASRKRAAGAYPEQGPGALERTIAPDKPGIELLREWAAIQVDPDLVYSTRRLGAPITLFKRLLMRLLRQYHAELESRQTRFNLAVVAHLEDLEARLARLERSPDE